MTKGTGDEVAKKLAEIFEIMTGQKYTVRREGFTLYVDPEEEARADEPQSDSGQSPEQDTEPEQQTLNDVEEPEPEPIELRDGLAKFRTEKGWYIKAFDDEGKVDDDNTKWLCSDLVKWIQGLPKKISARTHDSRDRAYPARSKGGIYVNSTEMLYLEELAKEQNLAIVEKEFERNQ